MTKRILFVDDERNILEGLRRMLRMLVSTILSFIAITGAMADSAVYTVGVVPQYETRRIHQIWAPIIEELQQRTGLRFRLLGKPAIDDFEAGFQRGEFDFAYMNPYHALLAGRSEGYIPLIRDVSRSLQGILVVRKDSGIRHISELDGMEVAFPSTNALGASLLMRQELVDSFDITIQPRYVNTHDSVYLNVVLGQTGAGGGVQGTLERQLPRIQNNLEVLHRTAPVPSHPLVAHPRIPGEVREAVQSALIEMGNTDAGRRALALVPIQEAGVATSGDYAALDDMGLERYYVAAD